MKTDKHSSTHLAILIKEIANLSLSQTIKTLQVLYEELKEESLQPLNRSGLYKAHLKLMKNKVFPNPSNAILQSDGAAYSLSLIHI